MGVPCPLACEWVVGADPWLISHVPLLLSRMNFLEHPGSKQAKVFRTGKHTAPSGGKRPLSIVL